MNPINRYRKVQRQLRKLFEPFTAEHCPTCTTPCCRKPNWVRPTDVVLVEELGYSLPDPPRAPSTRLLDVVTTGAPGAAEDAAAEVEMCDYLGQEGCAFPTDLRPFGCAAFICEPMRRHLPPEELEAVEREVAELEKAHAVLTEALFK